MHVACYIPIKIVSKFKLIISNFQNFPGEHAPDPLTRTCYALLYTQRNIVDTLCTRLVESSQLFLFLSTLP